MDATGHVYTAPEGDIPQEDKDRIEELRRSLNEDHARRLAQADTDLIFEVIDGPEGACLAVGFEGGSSLTRIAGPKPWGGGRTIHKWTVKRSLAVCSALRSLC